MLKENDEAGIKRAALLVSVISSFITPFMGSSVNIALPAIGNEFSMDAIALSWVSTTYLLSSAIFLVPFGKLADIYGRKKIFTIGAIIYTFASFFIGLAPNGISVLILRVIQGLGGAMLFGTSLAIISSVFPPKERGKAIGMIIGSVYVGLAMGPFVGGIMTENLGWRSIFIMNLPLGLIVIASIFLKLKGEWAEAKGEKLDIAGSIIYGASLASLIYGLSVLKGGEGIWYTIGGIAGLILFVAWELRARYPVLSISLFRRNMTFSFSSLAAFINYSATFSVTFLLSWYLQYIKDFTPQKAGFILVAQPVFMAIFAPLSGRFSDKIEPRIIASLGMSLTVAALAMMIFLTETSSIIFVIICLVLLGIGFGLFSSPNTNAIMSSVDKKYYGVASATTGTMRLLGQMFSMGITMLILSIYVGQKEISPANHIELMLSIKIIFIILSVLCFGGIFASLMRGKVNRN